MPPDTAPVDPVTPTAPAAPNQSRDAYPQPSLLRVEDDPNHAMNALIAKKRLKNEAEAAAKPAEKKEEASAGEKPKDEKPQLNSLIAKALKFTERKSDKKPDDSEKKDEVQAKEGVKAVKVDEAPKKEGKTIVAPKKQASEPLDSAKLVQDTAKATAEAVARAIKPEPAKEEPKVTVESSLTAEDLYEYNVAKHLSASNPKYKGADKVVLDHIKKSEDYASRWEAANQGKIFDSKDEEHNNFYESLEKPWEDWEFRAAEMAMNAKEVFNEEHKGNASKIKEMEQNTARVEMTPLVDRAFSGAAGALAKALGDDVHESIMKEGFAKLEEKDPLTAAVLTETLGPLQPIIETIIQIDDPKGRFEIDPKNPLHQKWNEILIEGEHRCVGLKDNKGRTFASRLEYSRMNKAKRESHWFLTSDHLIQGVVEFAAETAKGIVKNEKERIKKYAQSMGWKTDDAPAKKSDETDATKEAERIAAEKVTAAAAKPVSPTAGSGAKIDGTADVHQNSKSQLVNVFAKTLFKKG